MPLRIRRGTDAERLTITPAEGELIYTTDQKRVFIGDGTTVGGVQITAGVALGQLESNLDLNNYDIVGTGNLNIDGSITITGSIGANVTGDVFGNVAGNVLGNVTGDVKGSVFADDSTLLVDGLTGLHYGNFNGNLIGDVLGNVTGNVTGDVLGNVTGDVLGNVTGDLTGNVTGDLTGNVIGDLTGDVIGDVLGNVTGDVLGNVTGDLTGNVIGDVLGNVTGDVNGSLFGTVNGNVVGDVQGSIFANDSTLVVDAENGEHFGEFIGTLTGTVNGEMFGDLNGTVYGNVNGNLFGDMQGSVFSDDSTLIIDHINLQGTFNKIFVDNISPSGQLNILNSLGSGQTTLIVDSIDDKSVLILRRSSDSDLSILNDDHSAIYFERSDFSNPPVTTGLITAGNDYICIASDPTSSFNEESFVTVSNGSLGIGTFFPNATLDVRGNVLVDTIDDRSVLTLRRSSDSDLSLANDDHGAILFERTDNSSSTTVTGLITSGNNYVCIASDSTSVFNENVFVTIAEGLVGIGTFFPAAPLDVRGTAKFSEVINLAPLDAAPSSPAAGDIAMADRTNWDPLTKGSGPCYPVYYTGSAWAALA